MISSSISCHDIGIEIMIIHVVRSGFDIYQSKLNSLLIKFTTPQTLQLSHI